MVMLRIAGIGYEIAGFAATTSTTKGGKLHLILQAWKASGIHFVIQMTEVKEANRITVRKINDQTKMVVQLQLKSQAATLLTSIRIIPRRKYQKPRLTESNSGRKSKRRHWRFATKLFDSGTRTRIYVARFVTRELS